MPKTVVDCGNCAPDFGSIRRMIEANFDAQVIQTHGPEDTLQVLRQRDDIALVTVNRKLDRDYTDEMEVIRQIKSDPQLAEVPVMLVTNYPEHQQAAVAEGAVLGFGKLSLSDPDTQQRLQEILR